MGFKLWMHFGSQWDSWLNLLISVTTTQGFSYSQRTEMIFSSILYLLTFLL